ncbi:hypothetical protein N7509_013679 [Penicillium cosmopolitanum]|uniref:Zn(2)-C6 fungal-type domain-containing protein n=1 Tax=Penicillium cosmopolitanum TaxID=1131564 RepID=A0A9W9VC92_9EURO|nr:uncharacterized protein N7509_013679 [Penicillium cosmopolitanum]KAJ5376793.1 hypothetical protein N7509_013679 [Penicillium cosmopolitanum]
MPPKPNHGPSAADSNTNGPELQETSKPEEDVPACQLCRKKKARCNRAQPCAQCIRHNVPCVYDDRHMKPGLRAGVVDQLCRRIETLENMFLGQEMIWQQMWQIMCPDTSIPESYKQPPTIPDLAGRREKLKSSLLLAALSRGNGRIPQELEKDSADVEPVERPAKRPRLNDVDSPSFLVNPNSDSNWMPPAEIINELVDFYHVNIHPWIPILHMDRFRERIQLADERPRITCILHAIIAVCIRFSRNNHLPDGEPKSQMAEKSRRKVILDSTESFSVENLQALVILAFETIGRGRGPSSWSIVGSMVSTVEHLQLNVEEDVLHSAASLGETLIRRMVFLSPSQSWSEAEERRRIFWTVFLMDRFCSISTGWKVSLTNNDVKRRLPCEGALWQKGQEIQTPYFGIADSKDNVTTPISNGKRSTDAECQDSIGGFAYNIEATESLALVANFFLHHAFIVDDAQKAQMWLMQFKELDLRLIQWKLYLPSKWREACALNCDGVMDPNLTLAHITHNTAVILLHQGIAWPPAHWQMCPVRLPSASSAETCLEAASEIATIGQQFLSFSPIFTNPQFSFCLFIAGRMLLAHARYNSVPIPTALETLIASLLEISQRWTGRSETAEPRGDNLASSFAKRLIEAQSDNLASTYRPSLDIRQTAYSDESKEQPPASTVDTSPSDRGLFPLRAADGSPPAAYMNKSNHREPLGLESFSLAFPPLPLAFQQNFPTVSNNGHLSLPTQTAGNRIASQMDIQSPNPNQFNIWQNTTTNYDNGIVGSQDDLSHLFNLAPSPGQRISRYGGA